MTKDVVGYEGRYTVDTDGNVYNWKGRALKGRVTDKGYIELSLYDGKRFKAHRLVAQAFIANPEEYPQVDHIDENKQNNAVSNLRWCTDRMNKDYHHEKHGKGKYNPDRSRSMNPEDRLAYLTKIGKEITVDGKDFISCGAAAQYIVDNTEGKNKATISKELRRYLQGKKSAWVMYDRFTIGY